MHRKNDSLVLRIYLDACKFVYKCLNKEFELEV